VPIRHDFLDGIPLESGIFKKINQEIEDLTTQPAILRIELTGNWEHVNLGHPHV
jgi:hypothetical protein